MSRAQLQASRVLWARREKYRLLRYRWYRDRSKRANRVELRKKWWRLWHQAHEMVALRDQQLHAKPPFVPEFGVDFAWGSVPVSVLKAHGVSFVARYLSHDPSKNLKLSESQAYHAAGIKRVVVWETTAGRALGGEAAGAQDAHDALQEAHAVGAPANPVIYFAVDFDASSTQIRAVLKYFAGVKSILHTVRGAYGGHDVIKALFDAGLITHGWQTYAWSGGEWDSRAQLRQFSNGMTLGPVSQGATSVDFDRALLPNYGGW